MYAIVSSVNCMCMYACENEVNVCMCTCVYQSINQSVIFKMHTCTDTGVMRYPMRHKVIIEQNEKNIACL